MLLVQASPELQIEIRKIINEDVNRKEQDLETIKEWLRKQPHLPNTWDEARLKSFLRGCNYSLERCKSKLDMYFTMRGLVPEIFSNRDIFRPEMQEIVKIADFVVMPNLTPDGKRVTIIAASKFDFDTPDIANFCKLVFMIGDVRLEVEKCGIAGDVYVLDADLDLPKHFLKVSLTMLKKFIICAQKAYPTKIKEIHIVNQTPLVDFAVATLKPFFKEKIRDRLHMHPDLETLHRFVPKEVLPEEYGGTAGKLEVFKAKWIKKLEECTPWFKEQENVKSDESKRPGKPTNYEDLFVLPNLAPDDKRVFIPSAAKFDFDTPDMANFFKTVFMVADIRMKAEEYSLDLRC
ncbi:CRAL TRIO domain containing protein [Asbolus verrucosus]|uniref:CRAL TRIO domain containing protein n=1 Tax=Asbolus verrucosus TaxID=1661398 RepID=A0A482W9S9_ASBVE|nr:CRAL TRIO domain containing protein [Asbolus verrucosus]